MAYAKFTLNRDKLAAAVIYLAERSVEDRNFGEAKLVKLLYSSDCASFFQRWEPITGATYLHLAEGPCPQGWDYERQRLIDVGAIREVIAKDADGGCLKRIAPGEMSKPAILTDAELGLIAEQQEQYADCTAGDIDEYIRRATSWADTKRGEEMPYEWSMFSRPALTADTMERGRKIVAEYVKQRELL